MSESATADGRLGSTDRRSKQDAQEAAEARSRRRRLFLMVVIPAVAAIAGFAWYITGGRWVSTDDAYVQANKYSVSTDVSGTVATVNVHDNEAVKAGQLLFTLESRTFHINLMRDQAELGTARNNVEAMKAEYRREAEQIRLDQVAVEFAQRDWDRKSALFKSHVVAQDQLDQSKQNLDAASRKIAVDQQQLAQVAANLGGNPNIPTDEHPTVKAALAKIAQDQRDLDHCIVRAASDGIVANVPSLRPGMYLPAATPAFSLVETNDMWIQADPKESQLTYVHPGQKVEISVDTYPDVTWSGEVASLSPAGGSDFSVLPAQNTSGNWVKVVQRIPIRIHIDPDTHKPILRSGMSAVIDIDTGHSRMPAWLAHLFGQAPTKQASNS
ncbi:MAG TPA: HlyD family secretion protein [Stellaceae bacterium]|nr:HlyD family secretion protein [Stellaceae bacterium]